MATDFQKDVFGCELLAAIRGAGADVVLRGGEMQMLGAKRLSPDMMERARTHREVIRAALEREDRRGTVVINCATCEAVGEFFGIVNADGWRCAACLPSNTRTVSSQAPQRHREVAPGPAMAA